MTKGVLEEDGWFHTGDVGEVLPSGGLKIIDRVKCVPFFFSSFIIASESPRCGGTGTIKYLGEHP